jgi:hypothetical protein
VVTSGCLSRGAQRLAGPKTVVNQKYRYRARASRAWRSKYGLKTFHWFLRCQDVYSGNASCARSFNYFVALFIGYFPHDPSQEMSRRNFLSVRRSLPSKGRRAPCYSSCFLARGEKFNYLLGQASSRESAKVFRKGE